MLSFINNHACCCIFKAYEILSVLMMRLVTIVRNIPIELKFILDMYCTHYNFTIDAKLEIMNMILQTYFANETTIVIERWMHVQWMINMSLILQGI